MLVTVINCAVQLGLVSCWVLQLHHDSTPLFCLSFVQGDDSIGNSWASYWSWVYWWLECMLKAKIKWFLSLGIKFFFFLGLLMVEPIPDFLTCFSQCHWKMCVCTFTAALSISCRTSKFPVGLQTLNIGIEFLSPYQQLFYFSDYCRKYTLKMLIGTHCSDLNTWLH